MGAKAPQPAPNILPDGTLDPTYRKPNYCMPAPPPLKKGSANTMTQDNASAFAAQLAAEEKPSKKIAPQLLVIPDHPIGTAEQVRIKRALEHKLATGGPIVLTEPVTVYQCRDGCWEMLPRPGKDDSMRCPTPLDYMESPATDPQAKGCPRCGNTDGPFRVSEHHSFIRNTIVWTCPKCGLFEIDREGKVIPS